MGASPTAMFTRAGLVTRLYPDSPPSSRVRSLGAIRSHTCAAQVSRCASATRPMRDSEAIADSPRCSRLRGFTPRISRLHSALTRRNVLQIGSIPVCGRDVASRPQCLAPTKTTTDSRGFFGHGAQVAVRKFRPLRHDRRSQAEPIESSKKWLLSARFLPPRGC